MSDSYVDAEELDDAAIVAHAAPVHSPPSRARVRVSRRSVVIPERGMDDRTVVLARRGPSQPPGRRRVSPWLLWGLSGVIAFAGGGIVSSVLSARRAPAKAVKPAAVVARPAPARPAAAREPEVRVVSVRDLPVEKRR